MSGPRIKCRPLKPAILDTDSLLKRRPSNTSPHRDHHANIPITRHIPYFLLNELMRGPTHFLWIWLVFQLLFCRSPCSLNRYIHPRGVWKLKPRYNFYEETLSRSTSWNISNCGPFRGKLSLMTAVDSGNNFRSVNLVGYQGSKGEHLCLQRSTAFSTHVGSGVGGTLSRTLRSSTCACFLSTISRSLWLFLACAENA